MGMVNGKLSAIRWALCDDYLNGHTQPRTTENLVLRRKAEIVDRGGWSQIKSFS
jgi:hypothetical protein